MKLVPINTFTIRRPRILLLSVLSLLAAGTVFASTALVGTAQAESGGLCTIDFNSQASLAALDPKWQPPFANNYKQCGAGLQASTHGHYHLGYEDPAIQGRLAPRTLSPHWGDSVIELKDQYWNGYSPFELHSLYVRDGSLKVVVFWPSGGKKSYTVSRGAWNFPGRKGDKRVQRVNLQANGNIFVVDNIVITPPNLVSDPGFENQTSATISYPWQTEGPDGGWVGNPYFPHSGTKNAFIYLDETSTSMTSWNAIKQFLIVESNTNYVLTGYIKGGTDGNDDCDGDPSYWGYFGVRHGDTTNVLAETPFSLAGLWGGYGRFAVPFNSGPNTTVTLFAGYWPPGWDSCGDAVDSWMMLDDVAIQVAS